MGTEAQRGRQAWVSVLAVARFILRFGEVQVGRRDGEARAGALVPGSLAVLLPACLLLSLRPLPFSEAQPSHRGRDRAPLSGLLRS